MFHFRTQKSNENEHSTFLQYTACSMKTYYSQKSARKYDSPFNTFSEHTSIASFFPPSSKSIHFLHFFSIFWYLMYIASPIPFLFFFSSPALVGRKYGSLGLFSSSSRLLSSSLHFFLHPLDSSVRRYGWFRLSQKVASMRIAEWMRPFLPARTDEWLVRKVYLFLLLVISAKRLAPFCPVITLEKFFFLVFELSSLKKKGVGKQILYSPFWIARPRLLHSDSSVS